VLLRKSAVPIATKAIAKIKQETIEIITTPSVPNTLPCLTEVFFKMNGIVLRMVVYQKVDMFLQLEAPHHPLKHITTRMSNL
jgi:hypothetical protein